METKVHSFNIVFYIVYNIRLIDNTETMFIKFTLYAPKYIIFCYDLLIMLFLVLYFKCSFQK